MGQGGEGVWGNGRLTLFVVDDSGVRMPQNTRLCSLFLQFKSLLRKASVRTA